MRKKPWQFGPLVKNEAGQKVAELLLYGYIVAYKWWDEDEDVTAKEFDEELKALGNVDIINVRINSGGGDVFEAQAMYSMLKRHTATIHVYIDGLAASAASVVAMAGDKIYMPVGAMMMIHNPSTFVWGEAKDMRSTADLLDKVRDSIIAVYQTKTTKTENEIKRLMDAETWMTAKEAVEMGFADEIESEPINAVQDGNIVVINGVKHNLSHYEHVPKFEQSSNKQSIVALTKQQKPKEGEKILDIKTVEDLKQHFPELVNQIIKDAKEEAVENERQRIKAIDEISKTLDPELVNKAKYEEPVTAEKLALEAIRVDALKGHKFLENLKADKKDSGVNNIKGQPADEGKEDKQAEAVKNLSDLINKRRGK